MILCTLLITACGGKKTQVENDNAVSDSITERQQYRFECQFIKADDGNYDSIVVKGYKDGEVAFECHHELVDYVSPESAADMGWINDTTDINFDGIPDLQVFRGNYTRGQVAELYAGYVWTPQQKFEEVEEWKDLFNPQPTIAAMPTKERMIPTSGLMKTSLNLSVPVKNPSFVSILRNRRWLPSVLSWKNFTRNGTKKTCLITAMLNSTLPPIS